MEKSWNFILYFFVGTLYEVLTSDLNTEKSVETTSTVSTNVLDENIMCTFCLHMLLC